MRPWGSWLKTTANDCRSRLKSRCFHHESPADHVLLHLVEEFAMARKPASSTAPYSPHPSIAYQRAILDNLPEKSGKSIDEWVRFVKKNGPQGEEERRAWLRKEFKLGGT